MNYIELTTDRLIELIVNEVGVPLPTYDYNKKTYCVRIPFNEPTSGGFVTGVELVYDLTSFRDACIKILKWNDDETKNNTR